MKEYVCKKCGSLEVFIKENGDQTGLYCGDCGKWIKWLPKNEIELAKRFIEDTKKTMIPNKEINKETLEQICKKVSDFIHENYDPHTTAIITDTHIKIVQDIQGIPVKRWE